MKPDPNQLSLFHLLANEMNKNIEELSSDDWLDVIEAAHDQYRTTKVREDAEQARRKAEEKKRRQEEGQRKHNEYIAEITCMDLPFDWNNHYSVDERAVGIHTDSISDGLILSLTNLGLVDIEYIAQVSGYSYKEVIETLKGSIYQNPDRWDECFYKGWETADEYLSGNLMRKHKTAKEANKIYNEYFAANIKAIEAVLPAPVPTEEIYVTLSSS